MGGDPGSGHVDLANTPSLVPFDEQLRLPGAALTFVVEPSVLAPVLRSGIGSVRSTRPPLPRTTGSNSAQGWGKTRRRLKVLSAWGGLPSPGCATHVPGIDSGHQLLPTGNQAAGTGSPNRAQAGISQPKREAPRSDSSSAWRQPRSPSPWLVQQRAAQKFFKKHNPRRDPHNLDGDNDGIACESNS